MIAKQARGEEAFRLIEAAAISGNRCPQSWPHGPLASDAVSTLVEAKRIRSEVYAHNWRVAVILDGPHKGARTAPPPRGGSPYLVNGVHVDRLKTRINS